MAQRPGPAQRPEYTPTGEDPPLQTGTASPSSSLASGRGGNGRRETGFFERYFPTVYAVWKVFRRPRADSVHPDRVSETSSSLDEDRSLRADSAVEGSHQLAQGNQRQEHRGNRKLGQSSVRDVAGGSSQGQERRPQILGEEMGASGERRGNAQGRVGRGQ